jgi:hypothetical protein
MRRNHFHALLLQRFIQTIAVVRLVADQVLRLRLDHVKVEAELHQRHFMMIRRMRAHRQRQTVAIEDRHDLHTLATTRGANFGTTALWRWQRSHR